MRKKSLEYCSVLFAISLALTAFIAHAQPGIPPLVSALPEEAPASLFSTSIGDNDVELFVQGFWEASIQSLGTISLGGPAAATFNATPFLFTQRPDLYLLLVFRRQWWFEASVADDIERATWAIGYSGEEADFLKFARLGNTGILIPDYPYIAFGSPAGAFGAVVAGRDESKGTAFDAMVRWDGLSWKSRSFSGLSETVETIVNPRDQLRGRRFVLPIELPDERLSSIALYDHTSTGKRLLKDDEYSVSLSKGFIELKAEPRGVLSVVYAIEGVGLKPELGLYRKPGIEVAGAIKIDEDAPNTEARNLYALSDSPSRRELFVRNLSTGQSDLRFEVRDAGPGLIEVVKAGTTGPRPDSSAFRLPFSVEALGPDGQDWIYEPDSTSSLLSKYPPAVGYAIVARSMETVDAIVLGREAIPGTITVFRDGAQSEAYDFDSTSGKLLLSPPPRPGESILVRYAVTSADRSDGALVFAAGTRFPWLGLNWAVALGGRWSLPGVAYDASGELQPAWTGLVLGLERRESDYGFGAKAMGKYSRASANDLYRLAGMEDAPAYSAPFRPLGEAAEYFEVNTVDDSALAAAFPELMGRIHARNELNRVLSINLKEGETTGNIELLRYIEPAPLTSFGRLSFFIKAESQEDPSEGIFLKVQLGNVEGGAGGLEVHLPLQKLPPGWHKVEVDLNPVHAAVRIVSPGGQSVALSPAPFAKFTAVSTVSKIRLSITGLSAGTFYIDEIVLEEAEDGLSANFSLDFSLGKAAAARPPYMRVDLSGVIDETLSLGASLRAGWFLGPSEWDFSLAPLWTEDYISTAFGYTFAVPSKASATRLVDQYSQDIPNGSFARNISGVMGMDKLRLGLEAGTSEMRDRFSQTWKGTVAWGSFARLGLDMALAAPETVAGNFDPADVWLESWLLFLPTMESAATSRRLNFNASFFESRLSVDYRQDFSAPGTIATNAVARARLPFGIGVFGFEPFLERRFKVAEAATPTGFSEDFSLAFERAGTIHKQFTAIPFMDLFGEDPGIRFLESVAGTEASTYSTGAGFSARRPIGYGLIDLLSPNTMELLVTRSFDTKLESRLEFYDFRMKTTTAAVNLFGYGGMKPLIDELAYDEYASNIEASTRYNPVDGAFLPSIAARHSASVETRQGSTMTATSRFNWKQTRTGSQTSETLAFSLGKKPDRSWLGDLVTLVLTKRWGVVDTVTDKEQNNSVSLWFDSILLESAILRDSFDTSITVSGQELPGSGSLKTSISYTTRMIIPGSLSVGFRSSLDQSLLFRTEGWVWGFGYEFALEGRVSF
jgi:hypothetical protein